ncbi:MAG: GNAT family N-acetyltransferase [Microbacteriaceae bacterium]
MRPFDLTTDGPDRHRGPAITQFTPNDGELVAQYCSAAEFEEFMTTPWPYTLENAQDFITEYVPRGWETGRELTWALRADPSGPLLGAICLRHEQPGIASIGYWLGTPHRGRGYMTEAVKAVAEWGCGNGIHTLKWECVVGNFASMSVARRAGFQFTGTGPADVPSRDGSLPESWHGVLVADASETEGWPA